MSTKEISNAIRANDLVAYQNARYPAIQDGEEIVFEDEDFSGVDFAKFSMGFAAFHGCNLDDALHLYGQPIEVANTSDRRLDLRGAALIVHALDSDFSGMLYDDKTLLAQPTSEGGTQSTFVNCKIDPDAVGYFSLQGVYFA